MSETVYDWLATRETTDARSRNQELAAQFASIVGPDDLIVDLGCGTGANIRYLRSYFPSQQKWLGIDKDSDMLRRAIDCYPEPWFTIAQLDLASDLQRVPAGPGYAITASAFLDITSKDWLENFAHHCRKTPLLIALSDISQPDWLPFDELDGPIRAQIESHQRSDHGFGPSLGPDAAEYLANQLRLQGCKVKLGRSDWILYSHDYTLISMIIGGVARRVQNSANALDASDVQRWERLRREQLWRGELSLSIKHLDLLSQPKRSTLSRKATQ